MRAFEFIGDIYEEYQAEIDTYVSDSIRVNKLQDEEGNYLENDFGIDCWDEAVQYFGYEWINGKVEQGKFIEHTAGIESYFEII